MNGEVNLLTLSQVAERLSLNEYTIRKMLRIGELRGFKIRNRWRVRASDLEDFLQARSN